MMTSPTLHIYKRFCQHFIKKIHLLAVSERLVMMMQLVRLTLLVVMLSVSNVLSEDCFQYDKKYGDNNGDLKTDYEQCKATHAKLGPSFLLCVEKRQGLVNDKDEFDFEKHEKQLELLANPNKLESLRVATKECKKQYEENKALDMFHKCWAEKVVEICSDDQRFKI